ETARGAVRLVDFMPLRSGPARLMRIVEGLSGEVSMHSEIVPRFANGYTVPQLSRRAGTQAAVGGPDGVYLPGGGNPNPGFVSVFVVKAGDSVAFTLSWARPYEPIPGPIDPAAALGETQRYWESWCSQLKLPAQYGDLVKRSLITL